MDFHCGATVEPSNIAGPQPVRSQIPGQGPDYLARVEIGPRFSSRKTHCSSRQGARHLKSTYKGDFLTYFF